jgi:SAM-dependent methyltransferase
MVEPRSTISSLANRRGRAQLFFNWFTNSETHQVPNATSVDRYPELFSLLADRLANKSQPRILSFGCSTGEEVGTLLAYIPDAKIVGVDINRWNIGIARSSYSSDNAQFFTRLDQIPDAVQFDAIVCMAVLQHQENTRPTIVDSSATYPFDRFEKQVVRLDSLLRPGGTLIIEYANYRFEDTQVFSSYERRPEDPGREHDHPLFDRTNKRIVEAGPVYRVFEKQIPR